MTLAASELALVADELRALAGGRIQKITAATPHTVGLELRLPGQSVVLLLEAGAGVGRAVVVERRPEAPPRPLAFQGLLRAELGGARLAGVEAKASCLALAFETVEGPRTLWLELDRRGGALVLVGSDARVLGAGVAPGAPERVRKRGTPYEPPHSDAAATTSRLQPVADAPFPVSAAVEALYRPRAEASGVDTARRALLAPLKAARKKLERTLARVDDDLARIDEAAKYRRFGDLLKTQLGVIPRGASQAVVTEYTEDGPREVTVPLLPNLSPRENVDRYHHLHRRLGRARGLVEERRTRLAETLARLETLAAEATGAADANVLASVEATMRAEGLLGRARAKGEAPAPEAAEKKPFREFVSATGRRIWVGRNARANDELTLRVAAGNDLWLHARGRTGSHVVVPGLGAQEPDSETLLDAAMLAAHFSSGRGELVVDVAATRRKHVQKPKGAAPGSVRYSQERNVAVRADEARLARILGSETGR